MTSEAVGDLEVIPRQKIPYRGMTLEEMDTDAVIRRHPAVALVDELAHSNAPGSKHAKRWQDVEELLEHGITVISTVNIQHLESLADVVETITGVRVRERIPDRIVDEADEIELVDISPHALRQRMKHGNVYPRQQAEDALRQYFREGNLSALRELALRKVATAVEQDLEEYMRRHQIEAAWPAGERVLVGVDPSSRSQMLLRHGWRMASRFQTDLLAVFVETSSWERAAPEARRTLDENLRLAADLGAQIIRVQGHDVAESLLQVARDKNVGTIVIGQSSRGRFQEFLRGSVVTKLLSLARGVDVDVVADADQAA